MHDHLQAAVGLAESIRYSGDRGRELAREGSLESSQIHYQFNETGLRLSADMTPGIYKVLVDVCQRLKIDSTNILAYVYASPEIQAGCYSADTSDCLISFTSGLIELMSEDELAFVIGHELGHFLLGHGADMSSSDMSTENMIRQRCKEISADRLGMLACSSKDAAFRALIKTTAGLSETYLRFDIGTYLDQIRKSANGSGGVNEGSTHPSLVMRCRALLWFSMSSEYNTLTGGAGGESVGRVDERLSRDMQKFVDGPANQRIADAKEALRIWMMAAAAIRDGSFDKKEQELISQVVGQELLGKMLGLFSGCGKTEVEEIVRDKLAAAIEFYQSVAPNDYAEQRPKLEVLISRQFSQKDFHQYSNNFLNN